MSSVDDYMGVIEATKARIADNYKSAIEATKAHIAKEHYPEYGCCQDDSLVEYHGYCTPWKERVWFQSKKIMDEYNGFGLKLLSYDVFYAYRAGFMYREPTTHTLKFVYIVSSACNIDTKIMETEI